MGTIDLAIEGAPMFPRDPIEKRDAALKDHP